MTTPTGSRPARRSGALAGLGALGLTLAQLATASCSASHDDVAVSDDDAGAVLEGPAPAAPTADAGVAPEASATDPCATDQPASLRCTGLYADASMTTIASDVSEFEPGARLWSDGAKKTRWIRLPPNTKIDTSDMNEWIFPVGTKLWKQFVVADKKVETRYLEKLKDGSWRRATFRWTDDEKDANELLDGEKGVGGTTYDVPAQKLCSVCHTGRKDGVLGFEAVGLSSPRATGLTMTELVRRGLVTSAPEKPIVVPGNDVERPALEWLHANCGTACHSNSPDAKASFTGLLLRLEVSDLTNVKATAAYRTAVNAISLFEAPADMSLRIVPRDPDHSVLVYRMSSRELGQQMPPLATHIVDPDGLAAVRAWIQSM